MSRSVVSIPPAATFDLWQGAVRVVGTGVVLAAALVWSYWEVMRGLHSDWQADDNYSVGQLVPFAALYLLWADRHRLSTCKPTTCWWALVVLAVALFARAYGLVFMFESAERYSLVLMVAAVVLLVAGRQAFGRVFWVLAFLFLMVPLPGKIHNLISAPLQGQATWGAVFLLELIGANVVREGNVMILNDSVPLAVAEACSGLRMLTSFVIVGCVLAYVINRPRWQKSVLVLGTVPVAIVCNMLRLVMTALLYLVANTETAERFFHDFAGLTMMPIAVGLMLVELWIMGLLVVPEER